MGKQAGANNKPTLQKFMVLLLRLSFSHFFISTYSNNDGELGAK
jgi:hypothetical protein